VIRPGAASGLSDSDSDSHFDWARGGHDMGWSFAFDAEGGNAVRISRWASRLRAVVVESLQAGGTRKLSTIHAQAHALLQRGVCADRTVDVLGQHLPRAVHRLGPEFALTVIDLGPCGEVDVASRYAPPVLMTLPGDFVWLLPAPLPGAGAHAARVAPGGRLIASTGTFLGDLDPRLLSRLPRLAGSETASDLLATLSGARATGGLLIATRAPDGAGHGVVAEQSSTSPTRESA
jgi:hypothetical protein